MRAVIGISALFLVLGVIPALPQVLNPPSDFSLKMDLGGGAVTPANDVQTQGLDEFPTEIPTNKLSKIAQSSALDSIGSARSAKDFQIYRAISPAVVLIATKDGFGSGSLTDSAGDILTNWHVVKGYENVAVVFKPTVEGKQPTKDEIRVGRVVKYDEVADLALVKASEAPIGRSPIRLGDASEIAVGMDVRAIGHPTGEGWTYTTGVISQIRLAYEWQENGDPVKHKADIIQTQTPINPGNSGGPLLSDSGNLIGVNSFKAAGEGLNFAVSVDEVRKFIARQQAGLHNSACRQRTKEAASPKSCQNSETKRTMKLSFLTICSAVERATVN
jgi:S1-C subfamily serine protease